MSGKLKRVAPGWLAKSIQDAKNMSPEQRRWFEVVRANWVRE
jgi:hypothetical protein